VKKQLLTLQMRRKRVAWAKRYRHWTKDDWSKVLFSDESQFTVQGQRSQFVRRSLGEPIRPCHIDQGVKHPPAKMFWGCFSKYGPGPLLAIDGMMNSDVYISVLRRKVIPELSKRFPNGDGVFQHDLAPCHTSRKVKDFMQDNSVTLLDWPGNSPDINPIENFWSVIKSRLRNRDCTTKVKLIEAVINIWCHDPELLEMCAKLVDSMPKRLELVLKARGGHAKY